MYTDPGAAFPWRNLRPAGTDSCPAGLGSVRWDRPEVCSRAGWSLSAASILFPDRWYDGFVVDVQQLIYGLLAISRPRFDIPGQNVLSPAKAFVTRLCGSMTGTPRTRKRRVPLLNWTACACFGRRGEGRVKLKR
jgi:hypothetical protein